MLTRRVDQARKLGLLEAHDLSVAVLVRLTPGDPQLRRSMVELGPVDGLRPGLVGKQPTRVNRGPPTVLSPSDIQHDAVFVQVWLGLPGGLVSEAGYDQLGSHVAITAPVAPSGGPARVLQVGQPGRHRLVVDTSQRGPSLFVGMKGGQEREGLWGAHGEVPPHDPIGADLLEKLAPVGTSPLGQVGKVLRLEHSLQAERLGCPA